MKNRYLILFLFLLLNTLSFAQPITTAMEGSVFENFNQYPLDSVAVKIFNKKDKLMVSKIITDKNGKFVATVLAGHKYEIETSKAGYFVQRTPFLIKNKDKNKKVFVKIKMIKKPKFMVEPDSNLVQNDLFAEVTNATRLTDENYAEAADREIMKREKTPNAYRPPIVYDKEYEERSALISSYDSPTAYDNIPKRYELGTPQLGETVVSRTTQRALTKQIPAYYSGYKIEILKSFDNLKERHTIFRKHGNIYMEQQPNQMYSYLLGDFQDSKAAIIFFKEVIEAQYGDATLVRYENGKRMAQANNISNKAKVKPPQ